LNDTTSQQILEKLQMNTEKNMSKKHHIGSFILCMALIAFGGYQYIENQKIRKELDLENQKIRKELEAARMVYVYSLEETMQGVNAAEKKKKFEEEAMRLNEEVSAAEAKIKNFTDEKLKQDFTDMYLNSLRLKRDNLVEEYQKMLEELSNKVNKGLEEIAKEKNANTIFLKSTIAVNTPYVTDITPELIAKLKK